MSNETIQRLTASKNTLKKAALAIRALNHPFREKIIQIIENHGEIDVTTLYVELRCEQSEASQALRILRQSNVVSTRRQGKHIFYKLNLWVIANILELSNRLAEATI